jgi:WD40 repeat protein
MELKCSPLDSSFASISADGHVILWDAEKKTEHISIQEPQLNKGVPRVGLAFSPDGMHLASLAGEIRIWDVKSRKEKCVIPQPGSVLYSSIAFFDNGDLLAAVGDEIISVYGLNGEKRVTRKRDVPQTTRLVFSGPGQAQIATVESGGTVKIWTYQE